MLELFAHSGEHPEAATDSGLLSSLAHQSIPVALLLCAIVLLAVFGALRLLPIKPLTRLLLLVPVTFALAIFYMPHQPIVSSIVLSLGFITTFALAFTMLRNGK